MNNRYMISAMAVAIAGLVDVRPTAAQSYRMAYSAAAVAPALPPAAWQQQDPANSLYKQARDELNRNNYAKAAGLFAQIHTRYPRSAYAPDAYYWQAFALYKVGTEGDLKTARALLERQRRSFPNAATVESDESASLLTRVNGLLARAGNSGPAEDIARESQKAARQCPEDGEDDVRIHAVNALLQMNSEQAMPILKQIMNKKDACSAKLREKAVFIVSQKRGPEVEDILLLAARTDPSSRVREQAVFWLSQVNTDRALGYLEDILKNTNDDKVADKAIFAISQHRSARASQMLRDYAANQSADFKLRDRAIFWLGQRKNEETGAFLRELYSRERDHRLKDKIIFSLSQQRGNESWLMDLATNEGESIEMRKKALFWAGQSRNTSLAELTGLYDRMKSREMKDQMIFVYSQRREAQAVDKLMDIARKESDRELRKKAVFWLGQSKDPRAADFLMQLINQ
jgi:HEAT repeat protein